MAREMDMARGIIMHDRWEAPWKDYALRHHPSYPSLRNSARHKLHNVNRKATSNVYRSTSKMRPSSRQTRANSCLEEKRTQIDVNHRMQPPEPASLEP